MSKIRPRIITAGLATLTALTLAACSSGEGAQNAVALGGTFQFHSPGGLSASSRACRSAPWNV